MLTMPSLLLSREHLLLQAPLTRNWTAIKRQNLFKDVLHENTREAMKLLFYIRDIPHGLGERQFFKDCISYLALKHPEVLYANIQHIPKYGRWDDMFHLLLLPSTKTRGTVLDVIKYGMENQDPLLAKWLPRKGPISAIVRRNLMLEPNQYRHLIVTLSNTIEQAIRAKAWSLIKYEELPHRALSKYSKTFRKHDSARFNTFLASTPRPHSSVVKIAPIWAEIIKHPRYHIIT